MCFSDATPKWPKIQNGVIETHIPPSDRSIFSKKKVWGDISMSRRTCWGKDFFAKCHPMELSAKYRDFVRNCFFGAIWGYVTETHILVSDRNIFSKKKYVSISPNAGAHVGERNLLLSAIRWSYR